MSDRMTTAQVADYFGITISGVANIAKARGWKWEIGPAGGSLWLRSDVEVEQARRRAKAERRIQRPAGKQYSRRHDAAAPDSFAREGAEELARRIRDYWQRRGRSVEVRVEANRSGFAPAMRATDWYVVRSDMVNGWPRK